MGRAYQTNLGSAHSGTSAWIKHRVSFLILLPLTFWAIFCMMPDLSGILSSKADLQSSLREWVYPFWHGIPLMAWILTLIYHGMISLRTMIEDYFSAFWLRALGLLILNLFSWFLMLLAVFSFFRLWIS